MIGSGGLYFTCTRPDPTRSVEVGWLPPEGAGGAFQGREERGVLERVGVASRRVSVLPRGLLSRESAKRIELVYVFVYINTNMPYFVIKI